MKIVKFGQGRLFAGFGDGGCAARACGGGVLFFGGGVEASYELAAGGPVFALNIPAGQWHVR